MMLGSMVENHRSEGRLTTAADPHEVDLQHRQHSMMEDQLSRKHLSRTPRKLTGGDRHWVPCWHAEAGWARGGTGCRCLSVARCLPEVSGQLQGGGPLLSGVFLNDDLPSLNVAGVGSTRSTSGGLQLLSGVLLKDGSPSLNAACVEAPGQFPGVCSCWHVCFFER